MFRTITSSIILISLSSVTYAESYIGGNIALGLPQSSYGIKGVGASIFGGLGTKVGPRQNFYLGGELSIDHLHNTGLGASFIPGVMLTQNTMLYGRLGAEIPLSYSLQHHCYLEKKLGVGIQTRLTKNWDFRTEYMYSGIQNRKQLNFGLMYKFD